MNGLKEAIQDIGCSMQDIATDQKKTHQATTVRATLLT
jgi:hypothetical protein